MDFTGKVVNLDGTAYLGATQGTRMIGGVSVELLTVSIPYFECLFQTDVKWGIGNLFTTKLPRKESSYQATISLQFPGYQPV